MKVLGLALSFSLLTFGQDPLEMKKEAAAMLRTSPTDPRIEKQLRKVIELAPKDAEAHHLYAQWALINHLPQLCLDEESKALALTPESNTVGQLHVNTVMALALDELKRRQEAEVAFRKALNANRKLPKHNADMSYQFVRFLQKQGKEQEAFQLSEELTRWSPKFGPAYLARGRYFASQKQLKEALEAGERALQLAGSNVMEKREAHAFLATTYLEAGNKREAERASGEHREVMSGFGKPFLRLLPDIN